MSGHEKAAALCQAGRLSFVPASKSSLVVGAVLALSGIELIFFIVAGMGLCFEFVLETVLIMQGCFRYC